MKILGKHRKLIDIQELRKWITEKWNNMRIANEFRMLSEFWLLPSIGRSSIGGTLIKSIAENENE